MRKSNVEQTFWVEMGMDLDSSQVPRSSTGIPGEWWLTLVLIERWDDWLADDVRHCGLSNALQRRFEEVLVQDRDFVGDRGLFSRNGIRMNYGNGRSGEQTCVLLLIRIMEARISTNCIVADYVVVGVVSIHF